ncbi:MAG: hypothetical protein LBD20_08300 [Spirochaetaceae bacterium]|nr:hypothetical protein [Spirochaetaceae bacterium]
MRRRVFAHFYAVAAASCAPAACRAPVAVRRVSVVSVLLTGVLAALISCGIEDYPYLVQVPPDRVSRSSPSTATVAVPSRSEPEFLNYAIYYRIYIGDSIISSTIAESEMSGINSTLYSDYSYIKPYTQADNNLAANTGSIFSGRNYFEIELESRDISSILNSSSALQLTFDFSETNSEAPRLNGDTLRRSTGSGLFNPEPHYTDRSFDGRFVNTDGLNASTNATIQINRDVANKSTSPGAPRYSYVSLYICAVGINGTSLTPIYSAPTHIGVFRLPAQWWSGEQ